MIGNNIIIFVELCRGLLGILRQKHKSAPIARFLFVSSMYCISWCCCHSSKYPFYTHCRFQCFHLQPLNNLFANLIPMIVSKQSILGSMHPPLVAKFILAFFCHICSFFYCICLIDPLVVLLSCLGIWFIFIILFCHKYLGEVKMVLIMTIKSYHYFGIECFGCLFF